MSTVPAAHAAVEARDLSLSYGASPAVQQFTLSIEQGEVVGIVGESGSGKSTIASVIAGFLSSIGGRVEAGELNVLGRRLDQVRPARGPIPRRTRDVAMIFQDAMTSLDPVSTIGGQLRSAMRGAPRGERSSRSTQLLREVGFTAPERAMKMRPGELSGGMRQRALIAVALAARPAVLIADEPTSALDVKLAVLTMRLLVDSARRHGTALIVITHDLHLAAHYVDTIVVMRHGRVVESGRAQDVVTQPRERYTQELLACVPSLEAFRQDRLITVSDGSVR